MFKATDYCLSGPSLLPREASSGLAHDHWPSLGSGFELGLPVVLSHVVFAGVDPYRVAHDAVEYDVGDGVAAEPANCRNPKIASTDIDEELLAPSDTHPIADCKALNVMASRIRSRLSTRSILLIRLLNLTSFAVRGNRLGSGVNNLPIYGAFMQAWVPQRMVNNRAVLRYRTIVATDGEPLTFLGFDLRINLDSEALSLHGERKALAPVYRQGSLRWNVDTRGEGAFRLG